MTSMPMTTVSSVQSVTRALVGGHLIGGQPVTLWVSAGRITRVHCAHVSVTELAAAEVIELRGAYVVPLFVDSHVHLAFVPAPMTLVRNGVGAVVDLAAPTAALDQDYGSLRIIQSGPMLTCPEGYPTLSWGKDGFGWVLNEADGVAAAVTQLVRRGVGVLKIALDDSGGLDPDLARIAVSVAHAHGIRVAVHALTRSAADVAASINADILAHTPLEPIGPRCVEHFASRTVISTLCAYGKERSAVENLRVLHQAGARVLYGTDLGNTTYAGIQVDELEALRQAGLPPNEIIRSATAAPAGYWNFEDAAELTESKSADFLIVPRDPQKDLSVLSEPQRVFRAGREL